MAGLGTVFRNLSRTPDEIRAENLRAWQGTLTDVKPIASLKSRERAKVAGVIQNIRIDPRGGTSIEATIIDGTGHMVAKWLGRDRMLGIGLGMGLIMEGVCGGGSQGELVILNPEYSLVSNPEHG
ncbi:MAG TPA: DNA-binding protein [Actinomycetota bacterium]|nr:DNA-binding protein [Actinomycetota bacterium]